MSLNSAPSSERIHIGIFGKRNVGKSSVINALTGQNLAIVSDVKGTTTDPVLKAMELLPLGPVVIIDTPGMRELGISNEKESVENTSDDIVELACECKFSNCRHLTEPGCAVKKAVEAGEISEKRFKQYLRLRK